jgi:hypothetical protein
VRKRWGATMKTSRRSIAGKRSLSLNSDIITNLRDKQDEIRQRAAQMGHLLKVTCDAKQRINLLLHIDDLKLAIARVEQQILALQQAATAKARALEFA